MVKPVLHRWSRGVIPVFFLLGVAGMLLGAINPVEAQSFDDGRSSLSPQHSQQGGNQYQKRDQTSQFPANLPEWAEPSRLEPGNGRRSGGAIGGEDLEAAPPPPPPPPDQVPVDGGLAILAAAGAGYAVRRLRNEEDEEDEDELP